MSLVLGCESTAAVRLQSVTADRARPALIDTENDFHTVSHGELAGPGGGRPARRRTGRRRVHVPLVAGVEVLVGYLAGYVALVTGERAQTIAGRYRLDLQLRRDGGFDTLALAPQDLLYRDLAVLLPVRSAPEVTAAATSGVRAY